MDQYTATELAFKHGYEEGLKDAVKHGHWKLEHPDKNFFMGGKRVYFCSICKCKVLDDRIYSWETVPSYRFCPGCGAKMDGK